MEEIIHAFGIDGRLILIQILNFGLLLAALWYFLYTPIFKIIDDRKAKIEKGVKDAEAAAVKLTTSEREGQAIVKDANLEAEAIVARAAEAAKKESAALIAEGHERSERIATEARAKAKAEAEALKRESEKEITKMAILAAEKVLRDRSADVGKERA